MEISRRGLLGFLGLPPILPAVKEVKSVHFEPGDAVVIQCEGIISRDQEIIIAERWKRNFPNVKLIILDNRSKIEIIKSIQNDRESAHTDH